MNPTATIKLFLPFGDPKKVRTAEISNWSGKAVAAPVSDWKDLLDRPELKKPGVYFLLGGVDPSDGKRRAYVGEAEVIAERIKWHKAKADDWWNSVVLFVSQDDNLTKAHIRYLEGRLIEMAAAIDRNKIVNLKASGAHLPESDRNDMEVFLERIAQLLPVLGSDLLTPINPAMKDPHGATVLYCAMKGARAKGLRSPNGFVVLKGSTAVLTERESAKTKGAWILALREKLKLEGTLKEESGLLVFTRDVEFASPSAAATVVHGGNAAGPIAWKDANWKTLKELEGDS